MRVTTAAAFAVLVMILAMVAGCGGGSHSPSSTGGDGDPASGVKAIGLPNSDIAYNPVTKLIYVAVPKTGGDQANSVVTIDPATGKMGDPIFVGYDPCKLVFSDDYSKLYVGLANAIARFDPATMTRELQFSLGSGFEAYAVDSIAVIPGHPDSIVVARKYPGFSPWQAGIVVYDNDVPRPRTNPEFGGPTTIACISPTKAIGFDQSNTQFGYHKLDILDDGINGTAVIPGVLPGFDVDFVYVGGKIYFTSGTIIDPDTCAVIGGFPVAVPGGLAVDTATNHVFSIEVRGSEGAIVRMYDDTTFRELKASYFKGPATPKKAVICGRDLVAFRTDMSQVYIVPASALR